MTNLYGEKGKQFVANLPGFVAKVKSTYGLSDLTLVENLSYHYVLSGSQGTQPIIVKLGFDQEALKREALALRAFAGFGMVKILDEGDGLLLLECAIPGISLKSYFPEKENDALEIACACIKRLHKAPLPALGTFVHIKGSLSVLDNDLSIPLEYLHKARQLRDTLLLTSSAPVLLHGDLHHDNILKNNDNWVVIDPKGLIGEPAYEAAAFIRNPIPELLVLNNAASIIDHRIAYFATMLEIPEQRIKDWCFVQAVLAWAWTLEDGGDVFYFKQLTEIFYKNARI